LDLRIGGVEVVHAVAQGIQDVLEDGVVEIDPAQMLDPDRVAEQVETVRALLQHAGVERAAAQVVHRDPGGRANPALGRVLDGGGLRFGHGGHFAHVREFDHLGQQFSFVRAPVRWKGQHDPVRRPTHLTGADPDHPLQQLGGERLR
jgi:hypothetical protein